MLRGDAPLDAWLAHLETLSPTEIVLGLDRVKAVLGKLRFEPPDTVLHVTGTNGKGSSVVMLESFLRHSGRRVGAYLSPHVVHYNERVRIDGVDVPDDVLTEAFARIESVRGSIPLTYFEFGTLAALEAFAGAGVDAAVLEIGMGGRLDAVNAVEPCGGLITNVALDHCAWLGENVEKIAFEKAGIMRSGKPIVFASRQMPATIASQAKTTGADLVAAGRDYDWRIDGLTWSWQGRGLALDGLRRPSLSGDIQVTNAAGVLALLEAVGFADLLERQAVDTALSDLRLPGRMQRIAAGGEWLLDVAHNPAAAEVLAGSLAGLPAVPRTVALVGMLDDKDIEGVARALSGSVDHWVTLTAGSRRAVGAGALAERITEATGAPAQAVESVEKGLSRARELAGADGRVVVTGSFYVVGPVAEALALYSRRRGS